MAQGQEHKDTGSPRSEVTSAATSPCSSSIEMMIWERGAKRRSNVHYVFDKRADTRKKQERSAQRVMSGSISVTSATTPVEMDFARMVLSHFLTLGLR